MKKLLLSLLALAATTLSGFAAEEVVCDFTSTNWGKSSGYTASTTMSSNDGLWKTVAAANNSGEWNYIKIGAKKKKATVADVVSTGKIQRIKSPISIAVAEVVVDFEQLSLNSSTVDEIKVIVSDDSMFNADDVSYSATTLPSTGSTLTKQQYSVTITDPQPDKYYSVEITVTNKTTSNGVVWVKQVIFKAADDTSGKKEVTLSFDPSESTQIMGNTFSKPTFGKTIPEANVTFTISGDEGILSVDENGNISSALDKVGQATVTASIAAEDANTFYATPATYTLHVVDPNAPQAIYTSAMGADFTFSNPAGMEVWMHDTKYGLKGTAFINYQTSAAEAIAVSPEIDLTNSNSISLSFQNAFNNYKNSGTMIDVAEFNGYAYVVVKEAGATDWTELCEPTAPTAFSWDFFDNAPVDLSAYSGKKIQIGFKYVSTAEVAGTWEIKNIEITGKPGAIIPSTKPAGIKFETSTVSVMEGEDFTAPTLINPNNLTVTYSSTNKDVAIVDENSGEIVIGATGTTVITATFAGNDEFAEGTASYTLTVTPKPVLGAITINGEVAVKDKTYSFVEGSTITFAAENAEEIEAAIYTEDLEKLQTVGEQTSSCTWTTTDAGLYFVTVTTLGCNDTKDIEFYINVTEKPAIELVAEFIFSGENANVTSMVEPGKTLAATNDSANDKENDLTDDTLTAANGTTLCFTLGGVERENHPKYWLTKKSGDIEARIYDGNNMTVTAPQGYQITKITFTKGPGNSWNLTAKSGTFTNFVWTTTETGDLNSVVFNTGEKRTDIGSITVEIAPMTTPVAPEVPVVMINGEEVTDFDQVIDLKETSVIVTLTAPEGHHIYHKHVAESATAPAAVRAAEEANDFTHVENNIAEVTVEKNGTLHFYSQHVASGMQSPVKTLAFTGATTSLTEIEGAQGAASEWYDLQGRRVARPAKGGVYIRKQGSAITKFAL